MLREAVCQEPAPQSHWYCWCGEPILAPQWFLDVHVPKHLLRDEDALKRAFQQWCAGYGADLIKVSMCVYSADQHRRGAACAAGVVPAVQRQAVFR